MYRQFIARRFIIAQKDGSIDGTLAAAHKEGLVLEHVTWIPADDSGATVPMDGTILVPFGTFDFAQVV